ncbi:DUF4136 domain-containing protein [Sphingomonas pituitosa]|uniref:DUF4136 domain-containing protein n=1 Tax=Sphingomonas pituitosa TaxID=99597 RepID=UPI000835BD6D|nr:DUF4136 domain-containing protein [Sphingomonas pituitosa]
MFVNPYLRLALLATLPALAAGCTSTGGRPPIDVTRYHLNEPFERTTVTIMPMSGAMDVTPEFRAYADAVQAELGKQGYVPATSDRPAGYIASVSFTRASRGVIREPSPVSIGLGGGSFGGGRGGGVGLGGGFSFGLGKRKQNEILVSQLWVQLRRRAGESVIWEGRAETTGVGIKDNQPAATAQRLAAALFKDFPGESGITTTVK